MVKRTFKPLKQHSFEPLSINQIKVAKEYCNLLVKTNDPDRYLIALTAPKGAREALYSIYAFNQEIAKIPETVSEEILGQIKFQWWRESLEDVYGGVARKHAILIALKEALNRFSIEESLLQEIISSREFDLEGREPKNIEELLTYAKGTSGNLLKITGGILGIDKNTSESLGTAHALLGLMKSIKFHKSLGRSYLPSVKVLDLDSSKGYTVFMDVLKEASKILDNITVGGSKFIRILKWVLDYDLQYLKQQKIVTFSQSQKMVTWRRCRIILKILFSR